MRNIRCILVTLGSTALWQFSVAQKFCLLLYLSLMLSALQNLIVKAIFDPCRICTKSKCQKRKTMV